MNVFEEARFRESVAPLAHAKPLSIQQQRERAWHWGTSCPPHSPREYLLRTIATGTRLSKANAERYVFGTHLTKQERRRTYLKPDGEPFDLFLMSCIYDFCGEYNAKFSPIYEWENELHEIIRSIGSSKQARDILIAMYQEQHGPFYRDLASTSVSNIQPAF